MPRLFHLACPPRTEYEDIIDSDRFLLGKYPPYGPKFYAITDEDTICNDQPVAQRQIVQR